MYLRRLHGASQVPEYRRRSARRYLRSVEIPDCVIDSLEPLLLARVSRGGGRIAYAIALAMVGGACGGRY